MYVSGVCNFESLAGNQVPWKDGIQGAIENMLARFVK